MLLTRPCFLLIISPAEVVTRGCHHVVENGYQLSPRPVVHQLH
jgi:hypothetical protein